MIDGFMGIGIGSSHHWGRTELSFQVVAPAMIGASNNATDVGRLINQNHASVTASILKDIDITARVSNQNNRHTYKVHWLDIAWIRYIFASPNG